MGHFIFEIKKRRSSFVDLDWLWIGCVHRLHGEVALVTLSYFISLRLKFCSFSHNALESPGSGSGRGGLLPGGLLECSAPRPAEGVGPQGGSGEGGTEKVGPAVPRGGERARGSA